jgi:acetylornithine deacetylase
MATIAMARQMADLLNADTVEDPAMPDAALLERLRASVDAGFNRQKEFYCQLIRFSSLRGQEAELQDWISAQLTERGYEVDRYTLDQVAMENLPGFSPIMDTDYAHAVQVVAKRRAAVPIGRSLILQGHVDVVPTGPLELWSTPPFDPQERDGWMFGRGAGDMKQGVTAMIFALDAIRAAGLEPDADVTLQSVTEEECTGNGALSTLARGYRADAVLIPEPTGGTITRAHVGVMWFRLRVRGVPVHVAEAQAGSNAILSAFHLIEALQRHTATLNEAARADPWFGDVADPLKFNPGKIRGGDWASSTPAWCEVDCRIGLLPGSSLEDARAGVERCVAAAARTDNFLANNPPDLIWNGFQADGYVLEPGSEAERILAAAHHQVFGTEMEERRSTAVNDTRFYGLYHRMPALCYGPLGRNHHGFDECGNLESQRQITLAIAAFVADWCGVRALP